MKIVNPLKIKIDKRGFKLITFKDRSNKDCSLQISSLEEDAIWLGVNDAEPKILAQDAIDIGLRKPTYDEGDNGWMSIDVPKEITFNTRMLLTRKQIKALLPYLKTFAKTGDII